MITRSDTAPPAILKIPSWHHGPRTKGTFRRVRSGTEGLETDDTEKIHQDRQDRKTTNQYKDIKKQYEKKEKNKTPKAQPKTGQGKESVTDDLYESLLAQVRQNKRKRVEVDEPAEAPKAKKPKIVEKEDLSDQEDQVESNDAASHSNEDASDSEGPPPLIPTDVPSVGKNQHRKKQLHNRKFKIKSKRGQPIMKHAIRDLLGKLEK